MTGPAALDVERLETYAHEYGGSRDSASSISSGSDPKPQIIAVIPAYNEEVSIGSVVLDTLTHAGHAIVVDDYSSDHTVRISEMAGATVLSMHRHRGRTVALLTGLMEAERSECSAVVILEDRGKQFTDGIEYVVSPIISGEADVVIGVPLRKWAGGPHREIVSSKAMSEPRPGLWAMSSNALMSMHISPESYGQESEIIDHLIRKGLTILEVPISVQVEQLDGAAKTASQESGDYGDATVLRSGLKNPLRYIGLPGAFAMLGGAALLVLTMLSVFPLGTYLGQLFAGAGLSLVGLFLVFSSLLLALRTLAWSVVHQ